MHAFYMIVNLYEYRRYKKLQSINNFSHICFMRVENKKNGLNVVYDFNFRRVNLNKKQLFNIVTKVYKIYTMCIYI